MKAKKNQKKGFTLIELLVACSVFIVILDITCFTMSSAFSVFKKKNSQLKMQIKTNTVLSSLSDELRQISNIPNDAGLINPLGTNTLTFDRLIMTNLASNTVDTITVTYSYDSANHCLVRTCKGVSTVICDNILNPEDINFKYDSKNIGLIINLTLTDTSISAIADLPTIFFSKAYADGKSNAFSSTTNFNIVRLINFHVQEINDKSYPEKRFPVSNAL